MIKKIKYILLLILIISIKGKKNIGNFFIRIGNVGRG